MVAVLASLFSGLMGSHPPAGGEPMRSIDGRMRTQPAGDPSAEAWAALLPGHLVPAGTE
jgi:hypothetical protein